MRSCGLRPVSGYTGQCQPLWTPPQWEGEPITIGGFGSSALRSVGGTTHPPAQCVAPLVRCYTAQKPCAVGSKTLPTCIVWCIEAPAFILNAAPESRLSGRLRPFTTDPSRRYSSYLSWCGVHRDRVRESNGPKAGGRRVTIPRGWLYQAYRQL